MLEPALMNLIIAELKRLQSFVSMHQYKDAILCQHAGEPILYSHQPFLDFRKSLLGVLIQTDLFLILNMSSQMFGQW